MNDLLGRGGPFDSLVIMLRHPPGLALYPSRYHDRRDVVGSAIDVGTWPPWITVPDILVCGASREFAGLSCFVDETVRDEVRPIASVLDSLVARYNEPATGAWRTPYGSDQGHFFEVIWSQDEPDTLMTAQLAQDHWYYSDKVPPTPFDPDSRRYIHASDTVLSRLGLLAVGVNSLQVICESWNVVLPTRFRCSVRTEGNRAAEGS